MRTSNQNRKKAKTEAPHRSVQSAKWVSKVIGGTAGYQAKTKDTIRKVCAVFGAEVLGVAL
ncbi:MAG TPA: hypothetical protein DCZ95_07520 [Verrucomicrobia bacterium]|nr:MAG: hypothetical protein A2X46_16405 [Lentisphaerae bacterium GWF2_57_35]HBA83924.1 hypothetical protein [Verrucomicrobiota bacterium]